MTEKDICYGRLKPVANGIRYRRMGKPLLVDVSWWVSDYPPIYLSGSYLRFYAEGAEHRIYNPLRLQFSINQLVSLIKTFYARVDIVPVGFEVITE